MRKPSDNSQQPWKTKFLIRKNISVIWLASFANLACANSSTPAWPLSKKYREIQQCKQCRPFRHSTHCFGLGMSLKWENEAAVPSGLSVAACLSSCTFRDHAPLLERKAFWLDIILALHDCPELNPCTRCKQACTTFQQKHSLSGLQKKTNEWSTSPPPPSRNTTGRRRLTLYGTWEQV